MASSGPTVFYASHDQGLPYHAVRAFEHSTAANEETAPWGVRAGCPPHGREGRKSGPPSANVVMMVALERATTAEKAPRWSDLTSAPEVPTDTAANWMEKTGPHQELLLV